MAQLTFTSAQVKTRSHALLRHLHFNRLIDQQTGQPILDTEGDQQVMVECLALVGEFDGSTWTIHEAVPFSKVAKASAVATFFGTGTLAQMEQKALQYMQAEGALPAGTVS